MIYYCYYLLSLFQSVLSGIYTSTSNKPTNYLKARSIGTKYKSMKSANIPPARIKNSAQWHAWFKSRRQALEHRIWQAENAEWNWPSTRRRCELMHLKDELEELNAEEFVVPSFGEDQRRAFNTATAVWPPQPA